MKITDYRGLKQAIEDLEKAEARVGEFIQGMGIVAPGKAATEVGDEVGRRKGSTRRGKGRRGGVGAAEKGPPSGKKGHDDPVVVTYHPEEIVECSLCGAKVGTRRVGLTPYPYRHKDDNGVVCRGCRQPAKILIE